MKRFKSSQSSFREEMALGAGAGADLYAGHDHTRMAAARDHNAPQLKHERDHAVCTHCLLIITIYYYSHIHITT